MQPSIAFRALSRACALAAFSVTCACGGTTVEGAGTSGDAGREGSASATRDSSAREGGPSTMRDGGDVSEGSTADEGATGPGDGASSSCPSACSATQSGALCTPPSCDSDFLCVCDGQAWQCPPCARPSASCPSAQPTSGASCAPASITTDCPYPPPRATATTDCACGETGYKTGVYAWQCSPTYVYPAPPASGSACSDPGKSAGLGYGGLDWSLVCECPEAPNPSAWWCTMFGTSPVTPGSSCASYPRGYELWQTAGKNQLEGCTCGAGASPVWACASKSCPASAPADGTPCVDFPSFSDFTPSEPSCNYGAKSCICEASGLWLCG